MTDVAGARVEAESERRRPRPGTLGLAQVLDVFARDAARHLTGGATSDLEAYAADALLRDGRSIRVRALRPDDKNRLLALFRRQSPESIHYRFFGAKSTLSAAELRYFTELDFQNHVGLAAVRGGAAEEEFLGVARYIRCDDGGTGGPRAEFAVAVADAEQGRGVGTLLLEHLARIAQRSGIAAFEADVLGDNRKMFDLLHAAGFRVSATGPGGVVHVSFPVGRLTAADLR